MATFITFFILFRIFQWVYLFQIFELLENTCLLDFSYFFKNFNMVSLTWIITNSTFWQNDRFNIFHVDFGKIFIFLKFFWYDGWSIRPQILQLTISLNFILSISVTNFDFFQNNTSLLPSSNFSNFTFDQHTGEVRSCVLFYGFKSVRFKFHSLLF